MSPRVLIAEDHRLVREGLAALLERAGITVVGQAPDGLEATKLAGRSCPDVAVLDILMPNLNGLDAARIVLRLCPQTKVILLTQYDDPAYVLEAFGAGVHGFVLKTQAASDLLQAIRLVCRGDCYVSARVSAQMNEAHAWAASHKDPLTLREREVLQLVAEGRTNKEVAQVLGMSVKTVDTHRTRIMGKLGIHGTAGLVRYALRRGLIKA